MREKTIPLHIFALMGHFKSVLSFNKRLAFMLQAIVPNSLEVEQKFD
jgi:hypothetical protein